MIKRLPNPIKQVETGLIQFFLYVGILVYLILKGYGWFSVLIFHLIFVVLYGIYYFRERFIIFFFSPIIAAWLPVENYRLRRYLKKFKQNVPAESVIILGRYDWFKLDAWLRQNFLKSEVKSLVLYLEAKKQEFSFYPDATLTDVESIMSNKNIKEVYFMGHGDSHTFQLNTDEFLYYCEFNDPQKYGKEFVHQVHCGTPDGKSLIDYVVPRENRPQCFFFRRSINSFDIEKEFKQRIKNLKRPIANL